MSVIPGSKGVVIKGPKPRVLVTMGDPAGIGPEVLLKALRSTRVRRVAAPVIVGDRRILETIAKRTGIPLPRLTPVINPSEKPPPYDTLRPGFLPLPLAREVPRYIETAVNLVTSGEAEAIVTAPINKGALRKAGFSFPGHTEFLASLTGTEDYVMMLGGRDLKVTLVTIHEPIKKIPSLITREKILKTIKITDRAFRRFFAVERPRIGVLGLNPHAGEGGLFGDEEKTIIAPAIKSARRAGIDATGPVVPDTAFIRSVRGEFDVLVCMYHDQVSLTGKAPVLKTGGLKPLWVRLPHPPPNKFLVGFLVIRWAVPTLQGLGNL